MEDGKYTGEQLAGLQHLRYRIYFPFGIRICTISLRSSGQCGTAILTALIEGFGVRYECEEICYKYFLRGFYFKQRCNVVNVWSQPE